MKLFVVLALTAVLPFAASAETVKLEQQCTITFKGKIFSQGPCEVTIEKETLVTIKGKVPENGVTYSVIADDRKGTALMLGAGTFVLAAGTVETASGGATYYWPNGYAIDTGLVPNR